MKRFLIGKRVLLRGIEESDLAPDRPYFDWLNDLFLDRFTERSYFPNSPEKMEKYYRRALENTDLFLLGIFDRDSQVHIGNVTLGEINYFHRRASLSYLLGDQSYGGRGLATDSNLMMMYYGFNKLNLERIDAGVSSLNLASRRVCEKAGMIEEGRQRRYFLRNGEWADRILVGALRTQWMESHGKIAEACFETLPT